MFAYFSQVLESATVAHTYHTLDGYVTTAPFSKEDDSTPPKEGSTPPVFSQTL